MTPEELKKTLEDTEVVSNMPRPWKDCMCEQVAGDYEYCVIHPRQKTISTREGQTADPFCNFCVEIGCKECELNPINWGKI